MCVERHLEGAVVFLNSMCPLLAISICKCSNIKMGHTLPDVCLVHLVQLSAYSQ